MHAVISRQELKFVIEQKLKNVYRLVIYAILMVVLLAPVLV